MNTFFQNIGLWTTIIGFFGLFDLIVEDSRRYKLSEYIFGFKEISTASFESHMIKSLVSAYLLKDRLSWMRVFFYLTTPGGLLLFLIVIMDGKNPIGTIFGQVSSLIEDVGLAQFFLFSIVFCLISFPSDYLSVLITKKIFFDKTKLFPKSILWIIVDFVLSIILPVLLFSLSLGLSNLVGYLYPPWYEGSMETAFWILFTGGFLISFFVSGLLSILQVTILLFGLLIRFCLKVSKLNMHLVRFSKIHESPFAFLGVIAGGFFLAGKAVF